MGRQPSMSVLVLVPLLVVALLFYLSSLTLEREKKGPLTSQLSKLYPSHERPAQHLLAYQRLMAPLTFSQLYPACGHITHPPLPTDMTVARRSMSKSQDREDVHLYDMLFKDDKEPGVFLEIGALDGELFSNTYFYEHALGWKGILVEANPANAAKLRTAPRPRSAIFTLAVCGIDEGFQHPGNLTFSKAGGAVATAVDHAAPGFLDNWKDTLGAERVSVPCVPLQLLIDATGLWDIDLFSLDVEGGEKFVLDTVDLRKTNIRVIMIEQDGWNKEKDQWVRDHLVSHGFQKVETTFVNPHGNEIFVNPRFHKIKASRPPLSILC